MPGDDADVIEVDASLGWVKKVGTGGCRLVLVNLDRAGNLKELWLFNNNQLTALPDTFGQLTSLKTLNLYDNKLTALPDAFCQLESLETLNLAGNQLTALPDTFGRLTGLEREKGGYLALSRNPLTSPPLEVCTNGFAAIREYQEHGPGAGGAEVQAECVICLMPMEHDERAFLPCAHAFHGACIQRWLEGGANCPVCRQSV